MWTDLDMPDGRYRIVRHRDGPHRAIETWGGAVEVCRAKVRDGATWAPKEKIRFTSSILLSGCGGRRSLDAPSLFSLRGLRPATSR